MIKKRIHNYQVREQKVIEHGKGCFVASMRLWDRREKESGREGTLG